MASTARRPLSKKEKALVAGALVVGLLFIGYILATGPPPPYIGG